VAILDAGAQARFLFPCRAAAATAPARPRRSHPPRKERDAGPAPAFDAAPHARRLSTAVHHCAQYGKLIDRRVREMSVESEVPPPRRP
jgi:hypothetical protein